MGSVDHPHVAFLAFPFGTHAAPLFSVARALASVAPAGAAFSFLTSSRSSASLFRSNPTGPYVPVQNLRIYEISDRCPEGYVTSAEDPEEEVRLFMAETPGNYKKAMEAAVVGGGGVKITCVVSDAFLSFAGEMAAEMGVPWIPLWTGGPCSLSVHLYTDLLRSKIGVGEQALLDVDIDFIPGLSSLRVRDLPEGIVSGDLNGSFARLLHRMAQELPRSAAAVALNSFQGLHPALDANFTSEFKKSLPIGPLNLLTPQLPEPDRLDRFSCLSWLDRYGPATVAYISFGTLVSLPPTELAELALGLEASDVPFLWSLRESMKEQLPIGFLDRTKYRGLVVPWAPQVGVLGHASVGAFLTHCGWNSVTESVTCGVPMVCRPFFGDQRLNARVITHVWKVGVGFEDGVMTRDEVARALEKVVKGEEGRRMRERVGEFRVKAVQAVGPGGSSAQNFKALLEMVIGR